MIRDARYTGQMVSLVPQPQRRWDAANELMNIRDKDIAERDAEITRLRAEVARLRAAPQNT
jgi:hypothetical protein